MGRELGGESAEEVDAIVNSSCFDVKEEGMLEVELWKVALFLRSSHYYILSSNKLFLSSQPYKIKFSLPFSFIISYNSPYWITQVALSFSKGSEDIFEAWS